MDYQKYFVSKDVYEITISIDEDEFKIKLRDLPWSLKNQLVSQCTSYTLDGNIKFNGDLYLREVLKYRIVEAPWGATTDVFLTQIDWKLGDALQKLVPEAFGSKTSNREELKKVSSDS